MGAKSRGHKMNAVRTVKTSHCQRSRSQRKKVKMSKMFPFEVKSEKVDITKIPKPAAEGSADDMKDSKCVKHSYDTKYFWNENTACAIPMGASFFGKQIRKDNCPTGFKCTEEECPEGKECAGYKPTRCKPEGGEGGGD